MLYKRQKLLLNLVHAAGGELAATDLQKLLFLYSLHGEEVPSFKFVPYRYGCFSFQSYADRSLLVERGFIQDEPDGRWKIAPKATSMVDLTQVETLRHFLTRVAPERGDALVRRIYLEHPYYACRSEIIGRVFSSPAQRNSIKEAAPADTRTALFTIGYEGDSIDGYLDRLIRHNVHLLCDVRRNPLSRKPGFSGRQLASYCAKVGIVYRHLPELGIPGHRRQELKTQADYDALFSDYCREDLPGMRPAIQQLGTLLTEFQRLALTCFEKDPDCCHRHCVAEEMVRQLGDCPTPTHI